MDEIEQLRMEVRRLTDREAIRDLFTAFAAAMDSKDWKLLDTVWADDADFVHHKAGASGVEREIWSGKAEVLKRVIDGVSRHFVSHHIISNHRVVVTGDEAKAVAYLHSVHLDDSQTPKEHGDHGAWYLAELIRTTEDAWKIRRLEHAAVWFSGTIHPSGPIPAEFASILCDHLS